MKKNEMLLNLNICECVVCDCNKYEQVESCCIDEDEKEEEYKQYLKRVSKRITYLKQKSKINKTIDIKTIQNNIENITEYFKRKEFLKCQNK